MVRRHRRNREDDKKKLKEIIPFLESGLLAVRIATIKEVGTFGSSAISAAPLLLPFVSDSDETIRTTAMQSLVDIGHGSKRVAKAVRSLLQESPTADPYTKVRAYWILERIEST